MIYFLFHILVRVTRDEDPPVVCEISPLVSFFGEVRPQQQFLRDVTSCPYFLLLESPNNMTINISSAGSSVEFLCKVTLD